MSKEGTRKEQGDIEWKRFAKRKTPSSTSTRLTSVPPERAARLFRYPKNHSARPVNFIR
jgi:hypothetical protein